MATLIGIALAIALLFSGWFAIKKDEEKKLNKSKVPKTVREWEDAVYEASDEFGVPPHIAMAVLWQESRGNEMAKGGAGEIGLMQLKDIAVQDLRLKGYGKFEGWKQDPKQNIRAGVAYLDLQHERTGNWGEALQAYNQGFEGYQQSKNHEKAIAYMNEVKRKTKFFT